jgi:DNA-directed RNA polymerase subunit M/transcription elongation factor TFIIS
MTRWRLKSCPRCGGDLFIEKDLDNNWYEQCLQCSYRVELQPVARLSGAVSAAETSSKKRAGDEEER